MRHVYLFTYTLLTSLIIIWLISPSAEAGPYLWTGAVSKHAVSAENYEFNETHELLAVEYKDWIAGYMKNSFTDDTFFLSRKFSEQVDNFELSVSAGLSYGYRSCIGDLNDHLTGSKRTCPSVNLAATYNRYSVQPVFLLRYGVAALSVRWRL